MQMAEPGNSLSFEVGLLLVAMVQLPENFVASLAVCACPNQQYLPGDFMHTYPACAHEYMYIYVYIYTYTYIHLCRF